MATETALRGLQRGEWTSQSRRADHYSFCLKFVSQGLQAHSRASIHDVWLLRLAVACLSQTHEACESLVWLFRHWTCCSEATLNGRAGGRKRTDATVDNGQRCLSSELSVAMVLGRFVVRRVVSFLMLYTRCTGWTRVRQFCFRAGCREEPPEQIVPSYPEWQQAAGRERRKKS